MFSTVVSGAIQGMSRYSMVHVEADISDGLPAFHMVGLPGTETREAGDRVRVALRNSGFALPARHITINLSPADLRKDGACLDLPVAISLLCALGELPVRSVEGVMILGELGLDGEIKEIRGVLPLTRIAREYGCHTILVPASNAREGGVIEGIRVIGVQSLSEAILYLAASETDRDQMIAPTVTNIQELFEADTQTHKLDFADINGQVAVKRAVEIAAAGFHHLLMVGPPGAGKSMIATRIPSILPPLTEQEALEVSEIYSIAGLLGPGNALITRRPFLGPHHSITENALAGGGSNPRPGLISLAHRGILFLDELAEFRRPTLDLLRQPLEEKKISISRIHGGNQVFPAHFQLIAASNPCPCGYYPDPNKCTCTQAQIQRYQSHISGPLLDRLDLCVEVPRMDIRDLNRSGGSGETSDVIRARVIQARQIQAKRFQGTSLQFNSEMSPTDIRKYCRLLSRDEARMETIYRRLDLTARSYHKMLRVARTIADLANCEEIREEHLMEAVCYCTTAGSYFHRDTISANAARRMVYG